VRHVAFRMPDPGKRGKDIAILQMGQDDPELRYVGNDQAVLAHSGLVVARSQVPRPATRSELTRTRYVAPWQILLRKSLWGDERKIFKPLMRFARGEHSLKNHEGKSVQIVGEARPARWKLKEAAN
jgi:hypothetical protein